MESQGMLFDLGHPDLKPIIHPGEAAKEAGTALVIENNKRFSEAVKALIAEFAAKPDEFTSTDVRLRAAELGIPEPSHPNAWGACFFAAAKAGIIEKTGEYKPSAFEKSHAAIVAIWKGVR